MKQLLLLVALMFTLSGCFFDSLTFKKTASANDVYTDEFIDIPLPQSMEVDRRNSMISVTGEGTKTGLVTATGNVDKVSLSTAMIENMVKNGWEPRGMVRGIRIMELFEKGNLFAVLNIYDKPASVALELWVGQRLIDGAMMQYVPNNNIKKPSDANADAALNQFEMVPAK